MTQTGGRIDRVDVAVMIAILLLAIVSRGYRLEEPRAMYFDEVYHARTATEFLQDWRYGEVHDIYEWTHPHLAKYVMAASIGLFGGNQVVDQQDVGTGVSAAVYERRWTDDGGTRGGVLWVGGPDGLIGFDVTRGALTSSPISAPVGALVLDADTDLLYAATAAGISEVDTYDRAVPTVRPLFDEAGIVAVALAGDGIVTLTKDGTLRSWTLDGDPVASTAIDSATAIAAASELRLVVADTALVTDSGSTVQTLADITGDDPAEIEARLTVDRPLAVLSVAPDDDTVAAIEDAAADLPGVRVETRPLVAVGTAADEVRLLDATTLADVTGVALEHPVAGMILDAELDPPVLFVGGGSAVSTIPLGDGTPFASDPLMMPGPVTALAWNQAVRLIHVATSTAAGVPTVAVIETEGVTLFADAPLPFEPAAIAVIDQPDVPSDPVRVAALAADGRAAIIDAGSNAWAWRLPGVLAGALTVLLLYLLARVIARRRSVALAVAGLALLEGMMFVTARIAMNDVYVTLFTTAAVTLFAATWIGRWRRPWVVAMALIGVGLLLGLALASKWVGLYAIGGLGLLLLARSAFGRVMILLGLLAATAVLGSMAISAADVPDPSRNWAFLVLMLAITALVGAAMVRRPLPFEPGELASAGRIGVVLGGVLLLGGLAGGLVVVSGLGVGTVLLGVAAVTLGRSPAMTARAVDVTDGTPGFLLPARRHGLPWLFALGCLFAVPVVVYVLSYLPWVALGNQLVAGLPAGHTGQTLLDLTQSMYRYHDELRVSHPASSPWWAWMLDLKPVWMYLGDMAGGFTGNIYDGANPVIVWSSIAGLVFTAVGAWRRRDPGFALVVVMFLSLWLPWSRIDRATFQYHLTSSLPFALLALALLLSATWHRSRDGRLLVAVFAVAAGVVFVALYPTLSALPVGDDLGGWVTRLLPTWAYDYQFPVNLDPAVQRSLVDLGTLVVGLIAVTVTAIAMALATLWPGSGGEPHDRPGRGVLRA